MELSKIIYGIMVKNTMTVFVLTAIIFIAGIRSYTSMPSEAFPEIVTPEIYVGTPYPGNSPLDIEKLITRPLEKEINGISGVDKINSTSVEGYSTIQVKFNFDVTPDEALRKVKDKVDAAMGGARRDEAKARAKARLFSHRDASGQWDPKNQRPELWNMFNAKFH